MPERSPVPHRTPRNRALEVGSNPAGFRPGVPYNNQGGHPTGVGYPGGSYKDEAEAAQPRAVPPSPHAKPFAVK
jgi:hypothetical protein